MNYRRLLLPFSWIFGAATSLRTLLYRRGVFNADRSELPTICVGNLKVGGTGKTPHIEYLISLLSHDFNVAELSRGYRRESKGFLLVNELPEYQITTKNIGDEPMQLFLKFPTTKIAVSEKRAPAVRSLSKQFPELDVILLDDAFQHLQFDASLKIVLTEFSDPYFKDCPLPAGNLREFPTASGRADMIIVTKCPQHISPEEKNEYRQKLNISSCQYLFFTKFIYNIYSITDDAEFDMTCLDSKMSVILLSGIANPKPLYEYVTSYFMNVIFLKYSDHYPYNNKDIEDIERMIIQQNPQKTVIITTEKDKMRLLSIDKGRQLLSQTPAFTVNVKVDFLFDEEKMFNQIVIDHVRKKRDAKKN